jgi:hypothetical protein
MAVVNLKEASEEMDQQETVKMVVLEINGKEEEGLLLEMASVAAVAAAAIGAAAVVAAVEETMALVVEVLAL